VHPEVNHVGAGQFADHAGADKFMTGNRFHAASAARNFQRRIPSIWVTDARWSNGRVTTLIDFDPDDTLRDLTHTIRPFSAGLSIVALALSLTACDAPRRGRASSDDSASSAPYQSDVQEGLGAAVAILIDTSRSMREEAPGDSRPKSVVAREALEAMFDATESFVAKRPDFAVKVGIYSFSSHASTVLPMQPFDRTAVRDALARVPRAGGGTAIGEAMLTARPDLYRAGVFRKYLLVVTDGENTSGRSPDQVAREIFQKSEQSVAIYFVAFDTNADRFAFLKQVQGDVMSAGSGPELRKALDEIYQGRILAEASTVGEREPESR
jgi:Mg-chelatase subunit ChlD